MQQKTSNPNRYYYVLVWLLSLTILYLPSSVVTAAKTPKNSRSSDYPKTSVSSCTQALNKILVQVVAAGDLLMKGDGFEYKISPRKAEHRYRAMNLVESNIAEHLVNKVDQELGSRSEDDELQRRRLDLHQALQRSEEIRVEIEYEKQHPSWKQENNIKGTVSEVESVEARKLEWHENMLSFMDELTDAEQEVYRQTAGYTYHIG